MWDYDPYEFDGDIDDMEQYEREQLREDARLDREEENSTFDYDLEI
jgi:hypothetical protein